MAVAKRLSKVAKELGVGVSTIMSFLEDNGVEIDRGPNTKIEGQTYDLLLNEYQKDKAVKEKSQELSKQKVVRETISIDDNQLVSQDEEELTQEPIETVSIKTTIIEEEAPKVEVPIIEVPVVVAPDPVQEMEKIIEVVPETPVAEEFIEEKGIEAPKPEEIEIQPVEEADSDGNGPKIKGKIDLDKINQKTRPTKKTEPKPVSKIEKKVESAPKVKEVAAKVDPPKNADHITVIEKLTGPKILGKIEIKEPKPKVKDKKAKPVASSDESKMKDRLGRRKRKRIATEIKPPYKGKPAVGRGKKPEVKELDEAAVQKEIKDTLARLTGNRGKSKSAKYRKAKREAGSELRQIQTELDKREKTVIKATEFVTANEIASLMDVSVNEIISACMELGLFVSINQRLDAETLTLIAENFGYILEFTTEELTERSLVEEDNEERIVERPPIITVMGHVDHGKTSLLDYIRKENVIAGEAGGITQHIGAYSVKLDSGKIITFLDTPGHEAFTAMRSRGAQVTDVAIIVIASDDNVMPQTKEAINHAQAAGVPIVFAFNKMDTPGANADRLREELSQMNILVEDWGGKFQSQEISAKMGTNISELLDKVLIEAELLELKSDPDKRASGTVVEATLDIGKGYVTTVLVQGGTLRVGDFILVGSHYGKVKAMANERGMRIKEAGPSTPVSILGLSGAPNAGDKFVIMEDEREAKDIASKREQLQREQGARTNKHITLDEIGRRIAVGDFQELNVIIKGDVDGSIEALADSLQNLSTEKIQVNILHKSVGQISESDVLLASASNAIIVGFQVRPSSSARKLAEKEEIEIRLYSVIYKAIEELKDAMEGMLKPTVQENVIGNIVIRETFKISKVGTVAGCYVTDGKVMRNSKIRLVRDGIVKYQGNLGSLKRFKDDVKEVKFGYECGLNIENYNDIKVDDTIEVYEEIEVKQTLD